MKITDVRVTRIKMPRVDPAWRTASYAGNSVDGFILEIDSDGMTGIGGTAGHPRSMPADKLEAQLRGPIRAALLGADPLKGNVVRHAIGKTDVDARASIAADLALAISPARLPTCHATRCGAVRCGPTLELSAWSASKNPMSWRLPSENCLSRGSPT